MKQLLILTVSATLLSIASPASAKSCKKIDKVFKQQFGIKNFNEKMKPNTVGWFKKEKWPQAVAGIKSIMENDKLTPYARSTAFEEISKIYLGNKDNANAVKYLKQSLEAGGFSEGRNTYINLRIENLQLQTPDAIKRLPLGKTPFLNYPPMEKSGHCKTSFNLDKTGKPINVEVIYCTDESMNDVAIEAATHQKYEPVPIHRQDALNFTLFSGVAMKQLHKCGKIRPE